MPKNKKKKQADMNSVPVQEQKANAVISNQLHEQRVNVIMPDTVQFGDGPLYIQKAIYDKVLAENKELRDELSRYKSENTILIAARDSMSLTIKELREENEQLKLELKELREELDQHKISSKEEITNLKSALFKERLLAAVKDIIEKENINKYMGDEEWKKIRKTRNMAAHYLYEDKDLRLSENDLHERYSLFIDAYKKHSDLLVLNRDLETNKKLVSLVIEKITNTIDPSKINTKSDNYLDTKEYWQLA